MLLQGKHSMLRQGMWEFGREVQIEEKLIFKFMSVSTFKYQANMTRKVDIFRIVLRYI